MACVKTSLFRGVDSSIVVKSMVDMFSGRERTICSINELDLSEAWLDNCTYLSLMELKP